MSSKVTPNGVSLPVRFPSIIELYTATKGNPKMSITTNHIASIVNDDVRYTNARFHATFDANNNVVIVSRRIERRDEIVVVVTRVSRDAFVIASITTNSVELVDASRVDYEFTTTIESLVFA